MLFLHGRICLKSILWLLRFYENLYLYKFWISDERSTKWYQIYQILIYKTIFICQNYEIPWKNTLFHEKPIQFTNLFSIFELYIILQSWDIALQTYLDFFFKNFVLEELIGIRSLRFCMEYRKTQISSEPIK